MNRLIRALLITCLLTVSNFAASALALPQKDWLQGATGYERALQLQQESDLPLVIYFYVDWCGYCRALDRDYFSAATVQEYLSRVLKVRINPERGSAEREIAVRYNLNGYPLFLVKRNSTSRPVAIHPFRRTGNLTPAQFAQACQNAGPINGNARTTRQSATVKGHLKGVTNVKPQVVTVERGPSLAPEFLPGPLPHLDQVLGRYEKAVGVKPRELRLTSRVAKGRFDVPGRGHGGRMQSYAIANKSLTVMHIDPIGLIRQGFDGRVGWEQSDEAGLRLSTGTGLAPIAHDAELYGNVKLNEHYASIKLLGKIKQGYREIYLVQATPHSGDAELNYFDVESGLLIRRDVTRQTSRGPVRAEIYVSDWRDVDGIKMPFKITQAMPGLTFVFTIEEVQHNVAIDGEIFRRPVK